ncbi:MAG TPA: hypothetical protein VFN74_17400 [Chloroflexota bacterium]|nr:hypothetical protein [Chloroflexota bacterium]
MEPAAPPEARSDSEIDHTPTPPESELRFWLRPLVMSVFVVILLALTWWDSRRVPTRPAPPTVQFATPPAGATVSSTDPALLDTLTRLRQALSRRDARGLANLADPAGVIIAGYQGALPETGGFIESDAFRLAQAVLPGSSITVLGWRTDPRGQVIVLTNGWQRRALRLSANSTLELTSLTAVGLGQRSGVWYWRWLLPDPNGTLAQQASAAGWQPPDPRN